LKVDSNIVLCEPQILGVHPDHSFSLHHHRHYPRYPCRSFLHRDKIHEPFFIIMEIHDRFISIIKIYDLIQKVQKTNKTSHDVNLEICTEHSATAAS
jgi:hypothetical protein